MKILKIRFENIHSLKGEHEINFGEGILADAGLFAITGPTGSGKSTLLDVITLALYNRIARVDKNVSNSILEDDGGIMTRNMKSCYAEVEYRVNGKEYRSHWSIERNRNNNLNARKQELVEVATGHILESGTKTPEKNNVIIGLSYEQFVKAMVLSQGEFSKLLQAPRNERNKLLEDITGAKSYREIGKAVYFRYKSVEKKIELKKAGLEGIELLSPEVIAEKKNELKTLIKTKPAIEKAYQVAAEKIQTRQELQRKQNEQKQLEADKAELKKDVEIFKPFKVELENHEKLSKYAVNLREFDLIVKEENQLKEYIKGLQESKEEAESLQKTYLHKVSELIFEAVDLENANSKLEAFRGKIAALQNEEEKKNGEANLYKSQLNNYLRNIKQLGFSLSNADSPEQFKSQFNAFEKSINKSIDDSGVGSIEELNNTLETARENHEKAGEFLTKKEQLLKVQTNIKGQNDKLKSIKEKLEHNNNAITSQEKDVIDLKKDVEILEKKLEQQRKHQSLEEYRQQLNPEEPCPLCGSIHHPYASEEPYFDAKEELLKQKKDSLKTKSDLLIALNEKNKYHLKEITNITNDIEVLKKEEATILKVLSNLADHLDWSYKDDLEILQSKRMALTKTIKQMEASKNAFQAAEVLKDIGTSLNQWETALKQYLNLNKERSSLYKGQYINKESNTLSTQLTQAVSNILAIAKQLQENNDKIKNTTSEKSKREAELKQILVKEGLENIEILRKSIIQEDRANKIRKRENELKERHTSISVKENELVKRIKELTDKDDTKLSIEALTSLFEESKNHWDTLSISIGKLTQSLEDDENNKKRQQKVIDELNLLKKDLALWKSMNDLIGDATGNKFSNFVQDLTLEQLIGFANKRLSDFSDRYLLDIPTPEEAEKSDTLKVFDKYMGNARRSVRTLSGGETFLVSLAMAFALSDIAARNVKIESLFIDEGFGTLDPETLDQAITILEKMQNEGDKSVGVISHVSALKERITTQIKLEKGSLGYSILEVVQ